MAEAHCDVDLEKTKNDWQFSTSVLETISKTLPTWQGMHWKIADLLLSKEIVS